MPALTEPQLSDAPFGSLVYRPGGNTPVVPEPEITAGRYGPDITFAGVPRTTLAALAQASFDIVFVGVPFEAVLRTGRANGSARRRSGEPTT